MNAHGQDVPQVKERTDHFIFTNHSPVLECCVGTCMNQGKITYPLRVNESTWSGYTEVENRTDYFSFTYRLNRFRMLTMHEPLKSNLPAENK